MAEFRKVAVAERSPTTCISCGQHEGPFIDLNTTIASVPTQVGLTDLDIGFYLCVGNAERPGCVVQMARMTGLMIDSSTFEELRAELAVSSAKIDELGELLTEALKKRTIPGETVMQIFDHTLRASATTSR